MTKKVEPVINEEQAHINVLVNRCLVFTDTNGKVLHKAGNPVTAELEMKYEGKDFVIKFFASSHAMGSGVCRLRVRYKGKLVLVAKGSYMTAAYDITANTYTPGDWEKKIPEVVHN